MWKYWITSVVFALFLGWAFHQFVGDSHAIGWYVIPFLVASVTALAFEARTSRLLWVGLVCIALGGLGTAYWPLLVILFLAGIGILGTAIAAWLRHHVKWLAT